jgi:hypothetical protein
MSEEHTSKFAIKNMEAREYKTDWCKFPASYKAGRGHAEMERGSFRSPCRTPAS